MKTSDINAIKARIEQMQTSHLFSDKEKEREIKQLKKELLQLQNQTY